MNRSQKGAKDAAEWMPARHGAWFAERVIEVKPEYGLTVDPDRAGRVWGLLAGRRDHLNSVPTLRLYPGPIRQIGTDLRQLRRTRSPSGRFPVGAYKGGGLTTRRRRSVRSAISPAAPGQPPSAAGPSRPAA